MYAPTSLECRGAGEVGSFLYPCIQSRKVPHMLLSALEEFILSHIWEVCVTYRRVFDWTIRFIDTLQIQNSGLQVIELYR
jgi:hypothetical protein